MPPMVRYLLVLLVGVVLGGIVAGGWPSPAETAPPAVSTASSRETIVGHGSTPSSWQRPSAAAVSRPPSADGSRPDVRDNEDPKRRLEARLGSEGVSPSWAAYHEDLVEQALDAGGLHRLGLDAPLEHAVECRTSLCRIELVFAEGTGDGTLFHLLQQMSGSLDAAQVLEESRPDGATVLLVYASSS
jgi:hypothetical protein